MNVLLSYLILIEHWSAAYGTDQSQRDVGVINSGRQPKNVKGKRRSRKSSPLRPSYPLFEVCVRLDL